MCVLSVPICNGERKSPNPILHVHIHIFEGRRLEGNNINPFVSVACDDQYYTTAYRKATNNPVYDEVFKYFSINFGYPANRL